MDPPYNYVTWSKRGRGRCADRHYSIMDLAAIEELSVGELAAKSCKAFRGCPFGLSPLTPLTAYRAAASAGEAIERERRPPGHGAGRQGQAASAGAARGRLVHRTLSLQSNASGRRRLRERAEFTIPVNRPKERPLT
jgi:hypothetical protein